MDLSTALPAQQLQDQLKKPAINTNEKAIDNTAREFESFFIYQVLELIQPELDRKAMGNGGFGEEMFRHVMNEHIADEISKQGGFGLADQVRAQLLKYQEVNQ